MSKYEQVCEAWRAYSAAYISSVFGSSGDREIPVRAIVEGLTRVAGVPEDAITMTLGDVPEDAWWPATLAVALRCHPGSPERDQEIAIELRVRRSESEWRMKLAHDAHDFGARHIEAFVDDLVARLLGLFDPSRLAGDHAVKSIGFKLPTPRADST